MEITISALESARFKRHEERERVRHELGEVGRGLTQAANRKPRTHQQTLGQPFGIDSLFWSDI